MQKKSAPAARAGGREGGEGIWAEHGHAATLTECGGVGKRRSTSPSPAGRGDIVRTTVTRLQTSHSAQRSPKPLKRRPDESYNPKARAENEGTYILV